MPSRRKAKPAAAGPDGHGLPDLAVLRGQEPALRGFAAALASQRVAGAYLLHGPEGVGRRLGALGFGAALLCDAPSRVSPCGACRSCGWNAAGTHPDFLVASARSGPFFKDDAEAGRGSLARFTLAAHADPGPRRGVNVRTLRRLLALLALAPAAGGRKVAVIDALEDVEEEGCGTLLKSLEEPPPNTTFLLLSRGTAGVTETILSRCQRVRFRPLAPDVVRDLLRRHGPAADARDADAEDRLVRAAQGSAGRAIRAAELGVHATADAVLADLFPGEHAPDGPAAGAASGVEQALTWMRAAGRDLTQERERVRELIAAAFLVARDRAAASGSASELDAVLGPFCSALEALSANVSPELVVRSLWARIERRTRLS